VVLVSVLETRTEAHDGDTNQVVKHLHFSLEMVVLKNLRRSHKSAGNKKSDGIAIAFFI